jgi:Zonular occludens toxin (Zot)
MARTKEALVEAIDSTAFTLLRKIGGDATMTTQESAILTEQVKAFGEIVKWAQARPGLIPKEEVKTDAKFAKMKDDFHAASSRAPRGRRATDSSPIEISPADATEPASNLGSDPGAGEDDLY